MAFDYASIAADVAEILSEFGSTATLTRVTPGDYDPATGTAATTSTDQSVTAVVLPVSDGKAPGEDTLTADRQAYISARGIAPPRAGDVLTWDNEVLTLVAPIKNLAPAGVVFVLYECRVRNG